ncbi:C-type lectin domain family 6 member A-like [Engraulis encrasicolus]|uniref:C-type lectin domain family 6 member A-like n=1 Tax=Engraulis encrasicolus TaxID=184585 RepID=UPI002FD6CA5E
MEEDICVTPEDIDLEETSSDQMSSYQTSSDLEEISSTSQATQQARERHPETAPPPPLASGAANKCYKWTAVCLGMLCVLLLGVLTYLVIFGYQEWAERHRQLTNCSRERDELTAYMRCKEGLEKPTCPAGWLAFECNCLRNRQQFQNWSEGRTYCQSLGADLVIIKTPEKQAFIKKYIGGWIGLKTGQNGSWTWIDDTPVSSFSQYWSPGQPDLPVTTDCVAVAVHNWHNDSVNGWYDYDCSSGQYPICEKSAFTLN